MSPFRSTALLAALVLLASSPGAIAEQRAGLGVGLVIVRECTPGPAREPHAAQARAPGQQAIPPGFPTELETLARCSGGAARLATQPPEAADPPRPPEDVEASRQILLIEF